MAAVDRVRVTGRLVFGDYLGVAVFFGCLFLFGLTGRLERLISDSDTVLNVLYNLGHGHLVLVEQPFGRAPGTTAVDGAFYGRNYGQAAFALPFYALAELLSPLLSPRGTAVALWTTASGGFAWALWRVTDARRLPGIVLGVTLTLLLGSALVTVDHGQNVQSAEVALIASTAVAGALCSVFVYRLVADTRGRRTGTLAAVSAVLTTPIWIWSLWPKRHVLVAALILGSMYGVARSRTVTTDHRYVIARAGAYAAIGLLTWVHAAEALAVFLVLLVVDLATAPRNDSRTLTIVAVVFVVSLLPTLVTNTLITGNPARPPRLLAGYGGAVPEGGGADTGATDGRGGIGDFLPSFVQYPLLLVEQYVTGARTLVSDPDRLPSLVLWRKAEYDIGTWAGQNLSIGEAAPILGVVGAALGGWLRRVRDRHRTVREMGVPSPVTLYGLGVAGSYLLLYVSRLPLNTQITVRYLFPVFPIALVLGFRNFDVGGAIRSEYRSVGVVYALTTAVVAAGGVGLTYVAHLTEGQAFTVHAAINVSLAVVFFLVSAGYGLTGRGRSAFALGFGVTAGAGTALYLAITTAYVHYGPSVLPVVEAATWWLWRAVFHF